MLLNGDCSPGAMYVVLDSTRETKASETYKTRYRRKAQRLKCSLCMCLFREALLSTKSDLRPSIPTVRCHISSDIRKRAL